MGKVLYRKWGIGNGERGGRINCKEGEEKLRKR
jgi:hypothetical protein